MTLAVIYDANVLYPALLRDLLMRLVETKLFQARWTDEILNEMVRSIISNRPELEQRIRRTKTIIDNFQQDSSITDYEYLIPDLYLPDPDDRHVLAAAIHGEVKIIVTDNIRDFPQDILARYKIIACTPDRFIAKLLQRYPDEVIQVIGELSASLTRPRIELVELLQNLAVNHIPEAVEIIWDFLKS